MSEQDDRYLYALAELDNLRKRSQKDVAIARDVTRREVLLTLLPLVDDYIAFADADSEQPDPEWMMQNRPATEETVRRQKFPQQPKRQKKLKHKI